MAADGNGGGGIAAVRPPPPFSQVAGPFGGKFGRCRSIWRPVLAAAGPLQGRYTRPLLMMLLLWNVLSAIFKFAASLLILFKLLFLLVLFQTRTRTM